MRIVFLGDSITDCERDRSDLKSLGNGYVKIISDKLCRLYPNVGLEIINKGVTGNEVNDLLSRIEEDALNLRPDAAVVMIGINDALHKFENGEKLDLKALKADLTELVKRLKKAGTVVIFLEPFLLPAPDKLEMRKLFDEELKVINDVCVGLCDEFIAYDEMLNGMTYSVPYSDYSSDGIHPTYLCSCLIADTAIKALKKHLFN